MQTSYSKCAHETVLPYDKVAIQHSFNILLTKQSKRSETNLGRALVGQLIKIGYLLKVTTELMENNTVQPIELAKEGAIYTVLGNLLISV
jgi:predicted signal transduction protein with EAL and GGDEF domain